MEQQNFGCLTYAGFQPRSPVSLVIKRVSLVRGQEREDVHLPQRPLTVNKIHAIPVHEAAGKALAGWDVVEVVFGVVSRGKGLASSQRVFLQALCDPTRLAVGREVALGEEGVLRLSTADLRQRADVRLQVVGRDGLVVSETPHLQLVVDPPKRAVGGGLRVEWSHTRFADQPWRVSELTVAQGDDGVTRLVLYLNDEIPGFRCLLTDPPSPTARTARDFLLAWLEQETWLSLGRRAVADLALELAEPGLDEDAFAESIEGTESELILSGLAPRCAEARGEEPSLLTLARALADPGQDPMLRGWVEGGLVEGALSMFLGCLTARLARK